MSKKNKPKHHAAPERPLAERIAKARQEGRTQQALELARQLYKHERTPAHEELARQTTLERGQQLQSQGMLKDAITVFTHALTLGGAPDYVARIAAHLAACGATSQALAITAQIADPAARQRIVAQAVDAALAKGPTGKALLPAELHASFDLVINAFAQSEAGRDDEVRAALQGIGLQSPFLEWKIFLRGLLAYYANDDPRTLENWQRLDPQRLPARLAAPLRFGFDPAFRQSQPFASHAQFNKQMDRLLGPISVKGVLQSLKTELPQDNLAPAFRQAEQAVAILRSERPELVSRLAHCFEWAILDHGQPEDLERYLRVFGRPADDPFLHRLEARALEARGMLPEAHKAWQNFIAEVAKSPQVWPPEIGQRVQAMIWAHMAQNAAEDAPKPKNPALFRFGMLEPPHEPLKPDAETCYQKALELAPDRLQSHLALFELQRREKRFAQAKKTGQELLKRFPNHAATLEALGEIHLESQDFKKAQEYFDQALQANPLDRSLRGKLAGARQKWGLELTLDHKYDAARAQYELALKLWEGSKTPLLCQWAVAEMKAKKPERAEELLAQAHVQPDQRLACCYSLVCESVRAALPAKEKKPLTEELKTALAQTPTPNEILALLEAAAQQRQTHEKTFRGQKTHEKTVLKFLEQITFDQFGETQLERLCTGLQGLQARKPWQNCLEFARRRFLKNPFFRLSWVDFYLSGPRPEDKTHLAREHLDQARRLAEALPRGELQQQLQERIQEREKTIAEMIAGQFSMLDMMGSFFGDFENAEDEED